MYVFIYTFPILNERLPTAAAQGRCSEGQVRDRLCVLSCCLHQHGGKIADMAASRFTSAEEFNEKRISDMFMGF